MWGWLKSLDPRESVR